MLRITLLGGMSLSLDSEIPEITHTAKGLLAYLVLHRNRWHPRQVLTGLFWGNYPEKSAQNCLRTALWRLRRALEHNRVEQGTYLVTSRDHAVAFNCDSPYWLDIAQFESAVQRGLAESVNDMTDRQAAGLESALELYNGELLDGFYDEWLLAERDRFNRLFIKATEHLMQFYHSTGQIEHALAFGRRILHTDPLHEEIHRQMMLFHMENGQRAMAIRQFEICRETLLNELGIEPMARTQALYHQLLREEPAVVLPVTGQPARIKPADDSTANMDQALDRLERAIHQLDEAQSELQHAIAQVEQIRSKSHPSPPPSG
jgi:DNA-binding SARP family transcriptional activator